ncbi:MAG: nucleotide-binding domain containing protein, partial [Bacteroidota bacterium]
ATGKRFILRTAASFVKIIGGIQDRGLLIKEELLGNETGKGGLIIIGSHVQKTTEQLEAIKQIEELEFIEFNQHLVLIPGALENEVRRVVSLCNKHISNGKTVVVFTRRERLDLDQGDPELELKVAVEISAAVTDIVVKLEVQPRFLIAKGGITSSDIGCKGLGVKKALVAGQIKPGIPVWKLGPESKYPGMPYIVFPGNVGKRETLLEIIRFLN